MVLALLSTAPALLLGGEWAGWACTYSSSGALQRVPESYLSKSSLEWGGAPAGFDGLTGTPPTSARGGAAACTDGCAARGE